MDRSGHTVTEFLNDGKTHSAIKNKLFERFNFIGDQLYEVELDISGIEHQEPFLVGFIISRNAQLKILELFYNFFK